MSCDWHIKCVDCDDVHRFDDANHQDDLMRLIIRHASAIAGLAALRAEDVQGDVEIWIYYGQIDIGWFATHHTHQLKPIDEYGRLDTQCQGHATCSQGGSHACVLDLDHAGDHSARREAAR